MSKSHTSTGIYGVTKCNDKSKQGFSWRYAFYKEGKPLINLCSVDINKLKEKVLAKGWEWIVVDEQKAKDTGLVI